MRRLAGIAALVAAALLVGSPSAGAHVLIDTVTPNPDGSARIVVQFDHSCDGADTTRLAMQLPENVEPIEALGPDGWTASIEEGAVVWEGAELETSLDDSFALDANLIGSPGDQFVFAIEQECADGDGYVWDDTNPEQPAARFVATADVLQAAATGAGTGGATLWQILAVLAGVAALGGVAAARWLPRAGP